MTFPTRKRARSVSSTPAGSTTSGSSLGSLVEQEAAAAAGTRGGMMRTVVVGASSGLGRCIGVGLARRGAQVALLARRRARLEDAVGEAGPGALAIECDVVDAKSCASA